MLNPGEGEAVKKSHKPTFLDSFPVYLHLSQGAWD